MRSNNCKYIRLVILSTIMAALTGCSKESDKKNTSAIQEKQVVSDNENLDCVEFVALWSAGEIAAQIGKTKKWVFLNYTVDLMDEPLSDSPAKTVGKLRASSYARIIQTIGDNYLVESPIDEVQGWIHNSHVKTISKKNPETRALCE